MQEPTDVRKVYSVDGQEADISRAEEGLTTSTLVDVVLALLVSRPFMEGHIFTT